MKQAFNRFSLLKKLACVIVLLAASGVGQPLAAQVGTLRVFVADRELPPGAAGEQRGPTILLPVVAIARELGYAVSVDNAAGIIRVRRVGIEAEFVRQTGEVRENGVTIISIPLSAEVVFLPNADAILLPVEAVAPLLNVSIATDAAKRAVRVTTRDVSSATTARPRSRLEVGALNYTFNLNYFDSFYYQNLNLTSTGRVGATIYQSNLNFLGGGNYRIFNFYSGNITFFRPQKDEFQFGDLTTTVGSELSLMNTLTRGASYTRPVMSDYGKVTFFGGRSYSGFVDNFFRRDSPALPFDTSIVGARFTLSQHTRQQLARTRDNFTLAVGATRFDGINNRGTLLDTAARYSTEKAEFAAEFAEGKFDVLGQDGRHINGAGAALSLSGSYRPARFLSAQARYDYYSPNFSNPTRLLLYNNRTTKSGSISLQPLSNLSFGVNASITDEHRPTTFRGVTLRDYSTKSYGASFGYDPLVRFLPRVSILATKLKSPLFGDFNFINTTFTREFKRVRPFVNYLITQANGSTSHSMNLGSSLTTKRYGEFRGQHSFSFNRAQFLTEEELRCQLQPALCPIEIIPRTRYRVNNRSTFVDWSSNHPLFRRLQLSAGAGYTQNAERNSIEFRTAATVALPYGQMLQAGYFYGAFNREFRLSIAGPLAFWRNQREIASEVTNETLLTYSTLNGRVYLDENGNRKYDEGVDQPMRGVRVRLNNGQEYTSDETGSYTFERIPPGEQHLAVEIADVRANLIPANGLEQTIMVAPRTIVNTAFRMVQSGALSGRIWHDANENGKYDEGEGLPDIRLVSSSGRDTYTDPDGSFLLSDLPPGVQTLFIDERYKPEDLLIPSTSQPVEVVSAKTTPNVLFIFKTKPRGKRIIDFEPKSKLNQ